MSVDSALREVEFLGDAPVGMTSGDQVRNLSLTESEDDSLLRGFLGGLGRGAGDGAGCSVAASA